MNIEELLSTLREKGIVYGVHIISTSFKWLERFGTKIF
jgi:predicted thioredoxin/glutaredoxin